MHLYTPWWLYKRQKAVNFLFARGYHIELGGGRHLPGMRALGGYAQRWLGSGYGVERRAICISYTAAKLHLAGRGDMIPNEYSYCELDSNVVDQWGIPVLRFHFRRSKKELLQAKHISRFLAYRSPPSEIFCSAPALQHI